MKTILVRFLMGILLASSVLHYGQGTFEPVEIQSSTDYIHQKTKVVFPKTLHGFKRSRVVVYDQNRSNVGSSYKMKIDKKLTTVSVYLYPAEVSNDNLRDQFLAFNIAVNRNATNEQALKPELVKINSGTVILNGIITVFDYNLIVPDFMKGQKEQSNKSLFSLYDCGKWNIKIRITSENQNQEKLLQLEKLFLASFNPTKIAEDHRITGRKRPNIIISKTAQSDSLLLKSTIAEANAKIDWLDKNKSAAELSTGLSDFEMESQEFAIAEKIKFYKENKDKLSGSPETTAYFEDLQKIIDNGHLKDLIWTLTGGVVDFPEGAARKHRYDEFVKQNNIARKVEEIMYRVYL
ncbi:MAG: hypothetical protein K0M56_06480 [Kaistella sp.]|nr:hypothetical protein [Kaistella sp.]